MPASTTAPPVASDADDDAPLGLLPADLATPWADAVLAATLFAVAPAQCGGVALRAAAGPVRERWLALLRSRLAPDQPWRRVPLHIKDERLLGGLDLPATLQAGRPVEARGLLAEADGGVLLLAMAERLPPTTVARLVAVLDNGQVAVEREGVSTRHPARLGVVALDEGVADDEQAPAALCDRLAFQIDLNALSVHDAGLADLDPPPADLQAALAQARARWPQVSVPDRVWQALCHTALALGIASLRASLQAVQVARLAAALDGRAQVADADAALAARLVLAPRAQRLPTTEPPPEATPAEPAQASEPPPQPPPSDTNNDAPPEPPEASTNPPLPDRPLDDVVLAAAQAAIPAGLLAQLALAQTPRGAAASAGKAGALRQGGPRGRPAGVRRGEPVGGARLNVIETLRAAAPWQRLRQASAPAASGRRVLVRPEDFHIHRLSQRMGTTTIFAVDASGSAALARLAETKGAVELLLADCYVRRDRVAVIAFRGKGSELLLPPTRSLVRAKRSLAGLPGGGGTPLACAIDASVALAEAVAKKGETPVVVLLTDGVANINRQGLPGRASALDDALAAARQMRLARFTVMLVDTSPRPQAQARALAAEMEAVYLPLPQASPAALSQVVKATTAAAAART